MLRPAVNKSDNITSIVKDSLKDWGGGTEADVRRVLVEPVLGALGWNIMDTMEVRAEHKLPALSGRKPDYTLFYDELPVVLVEAKNLNGIDRAKREIESYYDAGGKYVGIATDGRTWRVRFDCKWDAPIKVSNSNDIANDLKKISRTKIVCKYGNKLVDENMLNEFKKNIPNNKALETDINNTNEALRLFNSFVINNRNKFHDGESFNRMLRAYVNTIGIVNGEKRKVAEILKNESFDDLTDKDKIIQMCKGGKYVGIHRSLRHVDNESCRNNFLDLMEAFSKDKQYNKQAATLEQFIEDDDNKQITKLKAILTGILASLQPDEFMVYNKRSYQVLRKTEHSHLVAGGMNDYPHFNKLFRHISHRVGKSLVHLDIIANDTYHNRIRVQGERA